MTFQVVIPARFGSTRLPGKPLLTIAGRPMIEHVHERAVASGAQSVIVATDDARITEAVEAFGGVCAMTSAEHASGTDRVAEVAEQRGWSEDTVVVNLQGDEPCMPSSALRIAASRVAASNTDIATLASRISSPAALFSPHVVKVIVDDGGLARWFSRAPIPWVRDHFGDSPPRELPEDVPFFQHVGLYAFRVAALRRLTRAPVDPYERAEQLEQLRALTLGLTIAVDVVNEAIGPGVDSAEDLERVAAFLSSRGG